MLSICTVRRMANLNILILILIR